MLVVFIVIAIVSVASEAKTVALILARGGSKGVPLKNLRTIEGSSLLTRSVHVARISGLDDVTVATDHPWIALEALRSGAEVLHRSKVTATDTAPSIWGVQEFLLARTDVEIVVLLQATSPFIKPRVVREALHKIKISDCVFCVTRNHKLRWNASERIVSPANFKLNARPRRQDWSGELVETGAFYITRRRLIESGHFQNHK